MNVCYSTNENFASYMAVSIASLLENNLSGNMLVHVLYSDLNENTIQKLKTFENRYKNVRIIFHKIDSEKFEKFNLTISHITRETYFRYLIPELLPDTDRVLYLDGDTVVNGDVSELFEINLSGYYCAGVEDIWIGESNYKKEIGVTGVYINTGVVLFNIEEIRRAGIIEKLFQMSLENSFKLQDQDVINIVFDGKIKELDCIYNFKRTHQKRFPDKLKLAKIIHFVGPSKPWEKKSFNPCKLYYYKYEPISPLYIEIKGFFSKLHRYFARCLLIINKM